ncbi:MULTISPECIES: YuzD family protein [Ureibacillus]|jgi:disulfide oxidoreductase YuzD|uniref:Disulfide oxidoreductase YuzD n=1 Tax=Ureibacillus thermosphaericus TaxID=51173 RepID=A0A840PRX2_URETH|nr:YuzD family protein [Ureibacillus thermosphaericus]MBB5148567.1 disulfide oxidoreductase YuzD [Ureibacillus thermosphaericus]NKZ31059.1 YuzD family protein [Ureibacillus thermosphaericus]
MNKNMPIIEVFGADVLCASCVNAPSSKDTYEWLEAAIKRKYPNQPFTIRYIDINEPLTDKRDQEYAERIHNDEYFYPLVLINNEVVGEGYIQIQPVFKALEKLGFEPSE